MEGRNGFPANERRYVCVRTCVCVSVRVRVPPMLKCVVFRRFEGLVQWQSFGAH